jgi:hypothetical protein
MKLILKMASWTGGGVSQFLEMDCDEFGDWLCALREIQKEVTHA